MTRADRLDAAVLGTAVVCTWPFADSWLDVAIEVAWAAAAAWLFAVRYRYRRREA